MQAVRALGYASVSTTNGQENEDLKLQERLVREDCRGRGLTLVDVVRDVGSHARSDLRRPGLTYVLERLAPTTPAASSSLASSA